ncbi:YlbF family regulator [Alkalihalobacillus sp. R86527]|uniref:YlbF family regulator n=1 Tax=Alkalihalobacillus sp. R86527 TaxID=3093863 RepID=UPI0036727BED
MIATLDSVMILDQAEDLGLSIKDSEVAHEYNEARRALQKDRDAQRLIKHFSEMKDLYDEVQRFGRYHPDYMSITVKVREAKRDMDLHETVSEFKKAERNLEDLLVEVCTLLAGEVSPSIKVPSGNPFFDNQSCGGGCGSGGSCGCG